jgi:predicted lipid-binding transport protein (Tim44 family)
MIVTAFATGDRKSLKNLLSREVYDGFETAIRDRESKGETIENKFVSLDNADIIGAELRGNTAQVTVQFVSQLISATRDKAGNVIDGSPDKVTEVTDVWTFARDVSSRDPNWKLVATEAGQ